MRTKVTIEGKNNLNMQFGVSKVIVMDLELDTFRLDQDANGIWTMTVSKSIAPYIVDRVKAMSFDQFERPHQACYSVWRGAGMIIPLNPGKVNETRNDGHHFGGFIHFDRHPGEKWEMTTTDALDCTIVTRDIERIAFDWNIYKS